MLSEGEILINKVAQDKLTLEDGLAWFRSCDQSEHRSILSWLRLFLEQARPDQKLIDETIVKIPLKPSMTPVVIFMAYPFKIAASEVCNLPNDELEKSFITLMTLFRHVDKRRRETFCKNGCTHEWHNLE